MLYNGILGGTGMKKLIPLLILALLVFSLTAATARGDPPSGDNTDQNWPDNPPLPDQNWPDDPPEEPPESSPGGG